MKYIALLRGINISGKNKIVMSDLKKEFFTLGHKEVITYLNSGNVVFESDIDDKNVIKNNIQAMIKQAQKLQKDMMKEKNEIDQTVFEGKSSFVTVEVNGKKEILKFKIDCDSLDKDDIEALEDMAVVALNEAMGKVDKLTEQKLGKYTQGMPGLF